MRKLSNSIFLLWVLAIAFGISAPAFAAKTLQFVTYGDMAGWPEIVATFEEANPDIHIEVQTFPLTDYPTKVATMVAGGAAPDIMQTIAQTKAQWAKQGVIVDVTSRWAQSATLKRTRFFPVMLEGAKYENRYYGVPYDFGAQVWYFNLDWMAERGVVPPTDGWTTDQFRQLAQKLTDPMKGVYGTQQAVKSGEGFQLGWVYNYTGHDWFDESHTKVLVEDPAHIKMLDFWLDLQNSLQVTPGFPNAFKTKGSLYTGGYAMWQGWVSYGSMNVSQFTYNWSMGLMPKGPVAQKNFAQAHMFSICSGSKHQEEAWRFLQWIASYEGQKAQTTIRRRSPMGPYTDLWDKYFDVQGSDKGERNKQWVTNVLYGQDYARNFNYFDTWYDEQAIMKRHLNAIYTNNQPASNEMVAAAAELRALIAAK